LLVDPRDVESIADGIWKIYDGQTLRQALVDQGRRKVARWTPQAFADRLANILDQCGQAASHGR
jgi:glycosyltransferase involved in cell wall biosynthesis